MWKNLDSDSKETYYSAARKADEDHKVKYPGYYYSPKEARIRKGLKQRRLVSGLPAQMDALRFVKVYMSSAEKNNLIAKDQQTSLLRKLQTPLEAQNMETTRTQSPAEHIETVQNVNGPSNQSQLIVTHQTPMEFDSQLIGSHETPIEFEPTSTSSHETPIEYKPQVIGSHETPNEVEPTLSGSNETPIEIEPQLIGSYGTPVEIDNA